MEMNQQLYILSGIRALRMFLISMPVIVLYWQDYGLSMQDIFVLQVIFSVAIVLFELPSGYFADTFGRTTAIRIASFLATFGYIVYWALPTFWGFALAEILLALSSGFMSGAIEALLYESIPPEKRLTENTKWQGRLMMIGNLSEAIAAILAGVLAAAFGLKFVLIVQTVILVLAIPLSFMLIETRHLVVQKTSPLLKILLNGLHEHKRLQALNLFSGALAAGTLAMVWFVQPYWQIIGVDILYFGYLWAGLNLTVAFGSWIAHIIERHCSFRILFAALAVVTVGGYALLALLGTTMWALAVIPIFWLVRGISRPIMNDYVQREAADHDRATVLSLNQLAGRLIFSITSPWLGWAVDAYSFTTAFYASALVFGIVCFAGLILLYRSYR